MKQNSQLAVDEDACSLSFLFSHSWASLSILPTANREVAEK
jgi:hypothetical protein